MPRTLAPDEARAEAKRLRADADDVERTARAEAAGLRFMAGELEDAADRGLTINVNRAINRHMGQAAASNPLDVVRSQRSAGRGRVSQHPFPKALERANITMTEMAGLLKEHRSTVKSWLQRKIPRAKAEAIAKLIDLPATTTSWPAGIK